MSGLLLGKLAADSWEGISILSMCSEEEGNIWYIIFTPRGLLFTYFHSNFSPGSTACDPIPKDTGSRLSFHSIPVSLPHPPRPLESRRARRRWWCRQQNPLLLGSVETQPGPCTAMGEAHGKHPTTPRSGQQDPQLLPLTGMWQQAQAMLLQLPQGNPLCPGACREWGLPVLGHHPGTHACLFRPCLDAPA